MIIRSSRPASNFTVVSNAILEDARLDWREVGLLVYLLSKPNHWQISQAHLASQKRLGIDGVKAALKVLQATGYVKHKKHSSGHSDWIVYDSPNADKPLMEKPKVEKPKVEKPNVANPVLVNTDYLVSTENKESTDPLFLSFWSSYGKIGNKEKALSAWNKLSRANQKLASEKLLGFIAGLPDFQRKSFSMHASTYLNGKRWNDEPVSANDATTINNGWGAL